MTSTGNPSLLSSTASGSSRKEPILSLKNVSAYYGNLKAVDNVSFDLYAGETLAIVGESGSGKSTLALTIVAAHPGRVEGKFTFQALQDPDLRKLRGKEISMIFQDPSSALNPVYTIGWQLLEAIHLHLDLSEDEAYNLAIKTLEEMQIRNAEEVFEKYPHELSGGQKQRAMIAMASVVNPQILIADEPTTALDVTVQKEILQLIKKLQKEKSMALLLITHDMGVMKEMADEVIVLYSGQAIEKGSKNQVLDNPLHPYTEALIEASFLEPGEDGKLGAIKGSVPSLGDEPSGCRFHPRCPFMWDKCIEQKVPFYENENRKVRCFLYEDTIPAKKIKQHEISKMPFYAASSITEPLLKVRNLEVDYPLYKGVFRRQSGVFKAVKGVSFEVFENEIVGIVGESGSGKTTVGRCLTGLITPSKGTIEMERPAQMIFQDPGGALNPRQTIGEALIEPLLYHSLVKTKAEADFKVVEILRKIGFDPTILGRYPHEFSLGQKQRLAIARSLLLNPNLIVCDEPVSALDVSVQAQILNLFLDLKKVFKMSLLFISHDLGVIRFIASRVLVMQAGEIVEQGTVKEIFENPQHPYTKRLLESCPVQLNNIE